MRDYVMEYIQNMKSSKGFVISDHDYRNVIKLADNILFLNNGFLREIKDTNQLIEYGYLTIGNLKTL